LAEKAGLSVSLITQFGFEARPILRWIAAQRTAGIDCPVHVGIAGPASVATLAKFAIRCGVGASLRALARGHTAFARVLVEVGPGKLISDLVAGETIYIPLAGLHVFTFSGVRRTAEWLDAAGRCSASAP
jgi:methylenetetrahydrofolate reductase (NADPH)